ncbi:MAG: DUF3857 and transglutaminase domain-containing protein [Woeseiaceae bacterium]|nr:DUF3857 and transglutaminase domain-containing protein [Woeseiaceae bacterium]
MKKLILPFAGLILVTSLAYSAESIELEKGVIWGAEAQQPDLDLIARIAAMPPPAGDNQLDVIYRRVDYRISKGSVERTRLRAFRYNKEDALQDYGTLNSSFDASHQSIDIQTALVVNSDGTPILVDPKTVQVVSDNSFNVFSDRRIVALPMAGLDVGSIAIVEEVITTDRDKSIAPWSAIVFEQNSIPQGRFEITMSWDSDDLKPNWRTELEGMQCEERSDRSLKCFAENVEPYPLGENAELDDVIPQFVASESDTWQEISDWYDTVFQTALSGSPAVREKARSLADGLEGERAVLKAVHEFVTRDVRYVGLEHGVSAYRPHSTDLTLERRYGDCKDKAALMIDLLDELGIEMSPVLVSTTRRNPQKPSLPSVKFFDHLIVCGHLSDGSYHCLDGTDPYSGVDQLASYSQGRVAMTIAPTASLEQLPEERFTYRAVERLYLTLNDEGELVEVGQIDYLGAYGAIVRGILTSMNQDERNHWALNDYHNTVSDQVVPDFKFKGIDTPNTDLSIGWETTYDDMANVGDSLYYHEDAAWLDQSVGYLGSENEVYDYRLPGLRFESMVTVSIGDAWRVKQLTPDIDFTSRFGKLTRVVRKDENGMIIDTLFEAPKQVLSIEELEELSRFLEIVRSENSWRITGEPIEQ